MRSLTCYSFAIVVYRRVALLVLLLLIILCCTPRNQCRAAFSPSYSSSYFPLFSLAIKSPMEATTASPTSMRRTLLHSVVAAPPPPSPPPPLPSEDEREKDENSFSFLHHWGQESYLSFHQRVSKRRSIGRLFDIMRVMAGKVLRPLVCSLVKDFSLLVRMDRDWDEFWLHTRGKLNNAERVALGLPSLGPTFVKLGQALATRPDILHPPLADALGNLQDSMAPFDNKTAKRIIRRDVTAAVRKQLQNSESSHPHQVKGYLKNAVLLQEFFDSLSDEPIGAASFAQVYRARVSGFGDVAVKVQRPGIRRKVERDATLFHSVATWIESQSWPRGTPMHGQPLFGTMQIVQTVDEFTSRILEDMDFQREVENMQVFAKLYDLRHSSAHKSVQVVVPRVIPELCSSRVIVMEYIDGVKLTEIGCEGSDDECSDSNFAVEENLALVQRAIEYTLSQLLETGVVHADPHTGNLLKVRTNGKVELGYLDFGLLNEVPQRFRDGIVSAVVQVVFAYNIEAVADLCVDVGLLSEEKMSDTEQQKKLVDSLKRAADNILIWPKDRRGRSTAIPKLRFQNLLASLAIIVSTFEFTVPPYFLNNIRALATLEGIALKLDPNFNILRVIYPYSINHLMCNPRVSHKAQETFLEICRNPTSKLFEVERFRILLNDWAMLTGHKKRRIFWDLVTSTGGRHVSSRIVQEWALKRIRCVRTFLRWVRSCLSKVRPTLGVGADPVLLLPM